MRRPEYRRQLALLAFLSAVFSAGGAVLIFLGLQSYSANRAFADHALPAEGTVESFEIWRDPGTDRREDVHYAVVSFKIADGRNVRVRGPRRNSFVDLEQGDSVAVLYDAENPENAKFDSFMGLWFSATMLCAIGASAILIPMLTLWQGWLWAKRQR